MACPHCGALGESPCLDLFDNPFCYIGWKKARDKALGVDILAAKQARELYQRITTESVVEHSDDNPL